MFAKAAAILHKDLLTAIRYRNGLFLGAFGPAAQLVLSFYLAHAVGPQFRPEGIPYFSFLLVGTGFFACLLACMHGFLNVIQESQQAGTLEAVLSTSTPPVTLLCLAALSAVTTAFVQFALYLLVGLCLFPTAIGVNALGVAATLSLSVLIAIAFGIVAAGLQLSIQRGSVLLWLFGTTAWVVTGSLFPIGSLPAPIRLLAQWLPLTHSLTGLRLALFGGSAASLFHEVVLLLAFALVLLPASIAFFSWTLRRARRIGTLSFY